MNIKIQITQSYVSNNENIMKDKTRISRAL